ncbi:putative homogentisate 1,2-dioxygenase [Aspergillus homomorphus CBS 101889]|uniref:homogentisate 1,2-dioxygenase n=1 Tax=Aspergillus homomorphus (strain CBS 101889) TaxID=1450537 RepID=A0A395I961_ASPHC|nr:homogentisate 1,2-dioxygenase [Aspergillus homomorphus CBS 101889]RAL15773.1 homogentisate 1,2-dioxygenase [Aspergillus homomorphus CBS 101889]
MPSTSELSDPQEYQKIFHWAETQKDGTIPSFSTRRNDPYEYQAGFGNAFVSEAVPGTIPQGQNSPRNVRFGLYAEQITASAFIAPRHCNKKAWLYRARPAVAHQGFTDLPDNNDTEANFLPMNPRVHVSPTQLAWFPFDIPSDEQVDFVGGLKTVAGSGEPTLREGLATHVYVANANMTKKAFVNSDGEMLIIPQQGALDIQTEFGPLFVQPGELVVIQRGIRFRVELPDGPSRGYILEIWGSQFELPELGPLGANGLANARDFLVPTAKYEISQESWEIVYKLGGKFFKSKQNHSPFDVVAWHGNYVPYKYDLTKFVNVGSISVDHIDPSIFCVLTAKSRDLTAPLADLLIFSPRWDVASHTYRPPYYHRNAASELMGLIYGDYGGRSDAFQPGSISFECGMVPHGVAYEEFQAATTTAPPTMQISLASMAFMFESSRPFTITEFAWSSAKRHEHEPKMWDNLVDHFSEHAAEVQAALAQAAARRRG